MKVFAQYITHFHAYDTDQSLNFSYKTGENVKTVEEVSEGKKDNVSNEALMKYVKEYQDKGYVLPDDFDEESDAIYLFDKLEANNESISIKFSEIKIENFEIFKEKVKVVSVKDCKVEYSETDDFYEMTLTDDELGYNMKIKYYKEDNVMVFHSTGLQNEVG